KKDWLIKELRETIKQGSQYGQLGLLKGKRIMVEYAHPNTHKQFHIGHLRNITNGEAIVRILEALGAKVFRTNYQGDVGLHIAKCLWAICQGPALTFPPVKSADVKAGPLHSLDEKVEFLAKAYVKGNKAYETDPKAKQEILKINKNIYDQSDSKINSLWKQTRQWSLAYFERIYKRVYTHFDRYYFEREVAEPGKKIVLQDLKKGIFVKSKGAIIFPGSKYGFHDRVFITGEGNPTYEAKDMELGRLQFSEYHPDLIIHNVGPEQSGYFQVVFEALAQVFPHTRGKEYHLAYGWVRLKKGKMSSRQGNIIKGEWLLDEAKKRIKKTFPEVSDQTAEMIAVGAVKYSFLKVSPSTEVAFDFKESISLEGNSGPYLQYTYCRCQSVLHKSNVNEDGPAFAKATAGKPLHTLNQEELVILRTLYKFPEVVKQAGETYSPNFVCNFLYDLAQKYNVFYNRHRIIQDKGSKDKSQEQFRLNLTMATAQILKSGLDILGIKTPGQM
ncbi:MAG TPA: arginine--tRNA ligase, partial [Candidatus Bathyarchaeia archaeon]|nr:arginine--tRNA ligase [Candidatus Bathyarchaeia archaeon]